MDSRYNGTARQTGIKEGIVVTNVQDDSDTFVPGRVRVRIPNVCDDSSWAVPYGGAFGGGDGHGFYMVPKIGALVVCFFVEGDPDHLYYAPAGWRVGGLPAPVQKAIEETGLTTVDKIDVWASDRFEIVFDRRDERARLYLRSTRHPDESTTGKALMLEMDDETGMLAISAPSGITLRSLGQISIEAASGVSIQGRSVNPMGGAI